MDSGALKNLIGLLQKGDLTQKNSVLEILDDVVHTHAHECIRFGLYKFCIDNLKSTDLNIRRACMMNLSTLAASFDLDMKVNLMQMGIVQYAFEQLGSKQLDLQFCSHTASFLMRVIPELSTSIFEAKWKKEALKHVLCALETIPV